MYKVLLFLFVLAELIIFPVYGQIITVRNKTTLQPLADVAIYNASLQILSANNMIWTDQKGKVDLSGISDSDEIIFNLTGYQLIKLTLEQIAAAQYEVDLTEKTYSLDEVVVSASKFEEKKVNVPQQIKVLNANTLAFMNQQTTADVLQQSGSVAVQKSQQGGGSPVIRGFEANKVLLVVDGVRMNNAIYRGGHLQNAITLDNTILEKTEVLFGPGSVVYGSDALGGVIHFYTKDPIPAKGIKRLNVGVNAFNRYATANQEKTGHLDLNIGLNKIGFLTSFTYSNFGDLRQGSNRSGSMGNLGVRNFYTIPVNGKDSVLANPDPNVQAPTGYKQYDFLQKVLFLPNPKVSHTLNFQYSTSSDVPRYDRLTDPGSNNTTFKSAEWYYGPQKRLFASYKLDLRSENNFYDHAQVIAGYQQIKESRINRNFNSFRKNNRIEKLDFFTLNIDLIKKIKQHELRYGVEWTDNLVYSRAFAEDIRNKAVSALDTRYPDGGSRMQTMSGYVAHNWQMGKQWILTNGLRYSNVRLHAHFKEKTFFPFPFNQITQQNSALNGNLGFVFQPGKDWRLALVGSSGFRAPNVDDLSKVFESRPGYLIVPNPNLKPEYLYNADLSVSKVIADRIQIEATGYYSIYRNAINVQPFFFNGQNIIQYDNMPSQIMANVNAGSAYNTGFSLSLSADFTSSLSFTSTLNYTYGRILADSGTYPLDHIPPLFGRSSLVVKLRKFRGDFFVIYNGWKRIRNYYMNGEDNEQYATPAGMPAWYTLNWRGSYQVTSYLQLQTAIENILDRNYRIFASGISAPGRNLIITIRVKF